MAVSKATLMRIGILLNTTRNAGGSYQYSHSMVSALHELKDTGCDDEYVVFTSPIEPQRPPFNGHNWTVKSLAESPAPRPSKQRLNTLRSMVGEGVHREAWRWLRKVVRPNTYRPKIRPDITAQLNESGVALMLYPAPSSLAFETRLPYVMAIHDLQHRLQPEFPEVSAGGQWDQREYLFRNGSRYATLLLADSEVGKEDILNFYGPFGVTPDRVKVLPFQPASYLVPDVSEAEQQRVRLLYQLPERYLFYPAQFWPHKNHKRIVEALGLLKEQRRFDATIVFCGCYSGEVRQDTFKQVISMAGQRHVDKQIRYLGYVPDEDMSGIYAGAAGLVMPTFFGPTNIPILEAWALGCPVLTSDIRGIREQVQDAALLVDPRSIESIADGIYRLWTSEELTQKLIARGRERLATYTPADYRQRLIEIVEDAKARVGVHTASRHA